MNWFVVLQCCQGPSHNWTFTSHLLEYPEKRHCCSCIVYAWIPTVSGGRPSGEDRGPLDVWASVATHSSVFNTDGWPRAIALKCKASLPSWLMPVHKFNSQVITQHKSYFTSLGSPVAASAKHPDSENPQHRVYTHARRADRAFFVFRISYFVFVFR